MSATVRQTKWAQPQGEYKPTAIDQSKASVDFRITYMGNKNTIVWLDGRVEQVSDSKLSKLQSSHTWAPDF